MERPTWQKILDLLLSDDINNRELGYTLLLPLLKSKNDRALLLSMIFALVLFSPKYTLHHKTNNAFDAKLRKLLQKESPYFFRKLSVLQHKIYAVTDKYSGASAMQYQKMMELLDIKYFDKVVLSDVFNHRLAFFGGKYLQLAQWQLTHLLLHNQLNQNTINRCLVSSITKQSLQAQTLHFNPRTPKVEQLNLHFFIPKESTQLEQLLIKYPNITFLKNSLPNIPKALYQNKNLVFLYIINNPIQGLDAACTNWTKLQKLHLSFCRNLAHFPSEISSLQTLHTLNIEHCRLKTIPDIFFELKALRYLEFQSNKIQSIPNKFNQLEHLNLINLNQNTALSEIPESLFSLQQLHRFWIKDCALTKIPDSICQMHSLQELRLSNNPIKALPKNFPNLENLVELQLAKTKINCDEVFWETILAMKNLKELDLSAVPVKTSVFLKYKEALQQKLPDFDIYEPYLF